MFKKEKLKVAKVDLDNDLEIPEFDFDAPPPKDDRKPVKKIFDGLISGAKSTLFSKDLLKSTVRKAMPDGFGEAVDMAGTVSGEAKKIYSNAVNQIKPSVNEMARTAGKLAPAEKVKTKAALDSVAKWAKNNSEKFSSNDKDSQREAGLNLSLNEVFKFQAEQTIKATAEQNIKDKVQTGLEIIRHKDNFGLLNNISLNTSRLSQYQEKITAAFQKKSLEIQYRSYFVAIDALEESKRQNALVKLSLENITKNTALPEIVKTTQHESFKINARNKFWNSVNDGLFGGRNNLIGKISENIGKSVREKIASATEAFSMATMVMDGVVQQGEMAESFGERKKGLAESAAGMAGGMGVDYLASKAGTWVKGKLDKNKKLSAMSRKAGNFVSNAPQHLNEFKRGNKGETDNPDDSALTKVGNFFIRAFKSAIPNMDVDGSVESDKAESLTAPFSYTKQTHKSINEVIPGFLSRIFRELQVLRTGNTKIGLSTYDFTKNKFTSLKEANDSIIKSVMGLTNKSAEELIKDINNNNSLSKDTKNKLLKEIEIDKKNGKFKNSSKTYTQNQIDNIFDLIDPTGTKLDTKARDALGKKLLDDNLNTRLGSANRLTDKATFQEDSTKQYAELFATVFKDYFKDDDKEIEFNKSYNSIGSSMNDSRGFIQNLINLGQYDLLKSTGLINADGSKIDIKKLQSLSLGDGSDFKDEILNSNSEKSGKGINKLIGVNKSGFNRLAELLEEILDKSGTALSDYRTKKNIKPVSGKRALNALRKTPVSRWNYKNGKGDGKRHIGPMAQTVNQTMGDDAAPDGTSIDLITMNGITMSAVQELDKQQNNSSKSDSLIEAIINTNKLTLDKLEEIKQTILNTGGVGGGYNSGSLLGSLKGLGKAGLDAGKNLISGGQSLSKGLIGTIPFKGIKNIFEIAGKGVKAGLEFGVDKLTNLRKFADVFIEGEVEPRITEMKLRAGKYFMEDENGKRQVLTDVSKIKGKIVDETGKIIISTEELGNMFTKNVKGSGFLKLVTGLGSKIAKAGNSYSKFMLGLIPPALRSASNFANTFKNKVFGMLDEPIDIYIPGNPLPIMLARIMKHGGYISQRTQKIILRPGDIDGPVLYEGKIVLSMEDIQKGLLDSNGNPIKLPLQKIKDFTLKNIKTVIDFNKKIFKQAIGFAKTGISKIKGLFGKNKSNNESESKLFGEQLNIFYLRQIRDILDSRLPGNNTKKFNDTDGDGNREGSWKTMGKKVKDKAVGIKDNLKNTIAEGLGGGTKPGIVSKMINKMFGIKDKEEVAEKSLDTLEDIKDLITLQVAGGALPGGSGPGRIGRTVGKLGGAKNILKIGGKALGAAGAAYGAYSAYDNIQKGNYGDAAIDGALAVGSGALAYGGLGALGSVTGAVGGTALAGMGALASGAATAGGLALGGIGAVGGTILASPVLLGIAAVAAVGSVGYFGYKYLTKNNASKLELVRYVQYGFQSDKTENVSKVFGLEDVLIDKYVSYEKGTAVLKDKDFNIEKALGIFGIKKEETNEVRKWTYWFQNRFKPVFLTHLTALYGVSPKVKLADINSMKPEEKDKYLKAASFKEGPYDQNASPVKGLINLPSNAKDVSNAISIAQKEIDKDLKINPKSKSTLISASSVAVNDSLDTSKETIVKTDIKKLESVKSIVENNTTTIKTPMMSIVAATGAVIGGPVVIGSLALGGAALVGYKFFNSGKLSKVVKLRLAQYGFFPEQKEAINLVLALEDQISKNISYPNGVATFDDKNFNLPKALQLFGVSTEDEISYNNWVSWFTGRFKPVYLTHLTALNIVNDKLKISEIDDLIPDDKLKYLNLVKFSEGPYNVTNSPISSIKELNVSSKDVNQAFELAKEEIEKESKTNNKTLMGAVKNDIKNILNPNRVQESQPGQTNVSDDIKKTGGVLSYLTDKFTNSIATPLMAIGAAVGKFFGFNASVLETIRFKTYGLKTLERSKVSALRTLEQTVFKDVKFSSNGTAEWSSTAEVIIRYVGKNFGVESSSSENAKEWINWFVKRFLPVYLAYLGLLKQITGKEKQESAESSLKPSQEHEIATKISAINGVWAITSSPWSDYTLITDISEIKDNLALLREKSQKDELVEAKKSSSTISNQNKVKQSTVKDAIETKGSTDGETPPKETLSSDSKGSTSTVTGSIPKSAGGPLSSGEYASQYIKLGPGVTLDGLNPELKKNFNGMVEEYGKQTGKSLYVTSGSRTYQQQEALYKKDPKKAAKPGRSLHEFGLAFDASSTQLDELDKLGLMRKYGFTRPVGGETWHVEPSGIQQNIPDAKTDEFFATNAIKASLGRGGGGIGSIKGSKLASRDPAMAKQIFGDGSSETIQTADASKPTVQAGGEVVAGSKTEENKSEERKPIVSSGKGYIDSANKNTIASVSGENSKANDFKATVPGSGSGISGVPNAKPGTGLNAVRETIEGAAKVTGVDPELMLGIAGVESSFNPNAKAKTSSASGLYQFIKSTWESMISKHGKKYGLDASASPMDAKANALMGGEFLKANIKSISGSKPNPNNTDLYLAHFLGAGGANKLFSASPDAIAAEIMPAAAKANRSIFYNGNTPRTVSEIYSLMDNKVNTTLSGLGLNVKKSSGLGLKAGSSGEGLKLNSSGESVKTNSISSQPSPSIPNTSTDVSAPESLNSNETIVEPTKPQNKSFSKIVSQQPNSLMGFNNDQTSQPTQDTRYDMNKALSTVGDTLKESLTVQTNMYSVLKDILKSVNPSANAMKNDVSKPAEQTSSDSGNNLSQRSNSVQSGPRATKPVPVPMNRLSI